MKVSTLAFCNVFALLYSAAKKASATTEYGFATASDKLSSLTIWRADKTITDKQELKSCKLRRNPGARHLLIASLFTINMVDEHIMNVAVAKVI